MDANEIYNKIMAPMNAAGGAWGNSYMGQLAQANAGLGALKDLKLSKEEAQPWKRSLNSRKAQAVFGALSTGIGGITNAVSGFNSATQLNDRSHIYGQIDTLRNLPVDNITTNEGLAASYETANRLGTIDTNLEHIGKRNGLEQGMNVVSSAIQDAGALGTIAGPWGYGIGAVTGLGRGFLENLANKNAAEEERDRELMKSYIAQDISRTNLNAQSDVVQDRTFRSGIASRPSAFGGPIQRGRQTLKEFSETVLRRRTANEPSRSAGFVHKKVSGGLMVKVKVK